MVDADPTDPLSRASLDRAQGGLDPRYIRLYAMGIDAYRLLPSLEGLAARPGAFVDGRTAPATALGQLGEQLVAVHGQADQWRLRSAREHREVLDAAAGPQLRDALAAYRRSYAGYVAARDEAAALHTARTERLTELDALRYGLDQVDATAPTTGEDVALRLEQTRVLHPGRVLVFLRWQAPEASRM